MNNPSTSSSSSSTLHPLLQRATATASSSSRPLKRSADQLSEFESSPPSKRVKEQMPDDHIEVDEQLRVEKDEAVVKTEEQAATKPESSGEAVENATETAKAVKFVDDMDEELMCGCCAALLYHPVVISPCNHYFCGACTVLWVRNGGTSCPACRQPSTSVQHSRLLEGFVEVLLRTYPEKQRSQAERDQADEVYSPSMSISIPPPKPANQDNVLLPQSRGHDPPPDNLARPCPHCLPNNEFGWRCPRPLADPQTDPEHAWNLDNGTPPGHAWCGTCDELHPVGSPSTTKCSVCETSFCGLSVPHLCVANNMSSAHLPVSVSNLSGMIQSLEVYEAFSGNTTEVELLFDWLRDDGRGPRGILLSMIEKVRASPGGFQALIDQAVFTRQPDDDAASEAPLPPPPVNLPADPAFTDASVQVPEAAAAQAESQPQPETAVGANGETQNAIPGAPPTETVPIPPPAAPPVPAPPSFTRICRECCHELFLYRLYDWWAQERQAIVDAANAPPPPPSAEPPADVPPPPTDSASDTDEDDEDDDDDGSQRSRPTSRNRARTTLPEWATNPQRKDCPQGKTCENQHSPSHAKEFNHVIPVRDPAQAPPPTQVTAEGAAAGTQGEQVPSSFQTASLTIPPAPTALTGNEAPFAGSSVPANADVEMANNTLAPTESGRLKIEALLSSTGTNAASSSSVFKVDGPVEEDVTMEDADTANVEQSLSVAVGDRSSPPPAAGSSSVVVI